MVQQTQAVCSECRGEGEVIPAKDRCKICAGKKKMKSESVIEVHIDKGMRDGQKITFAGQGDQEPGVPAGDIIIVLDEQQNPIFTRKGHNLMMILKLELVEALCGCAKVIETLDNRQLVFHLLPGEVIKHDDVRVIHGEGMPHYKNPFEKGDLIIHFEVNFPKQLSQQSRDGLSKILPGRTEPLIPDGAEFKQLDEVQPRQRQMYDQDDDGQGGHPQAVRCQAQ